MRVAAPIGFGSMAVALALVALAGCRITNLTLWSRPETPGDVYEVEKVRDVTYFEGRLVDAHRHRADLFLPRGKRNYPVVVLVHGGAWMIGDNRCCGLNSAVGAFLASQGIGAVLPNYRQTPVVKHPQHVKDVARAFAWTKRNIASFGGDPQQLYLVGHSAGGHLVALLTTDEQYLQAEGCSSADIRGVVGISGVYRIPEGKAAIELGGTSPLSLRWAALAPLRGDNASSNPNDAAKTGAALNINIFAPAFGNDAQARLTASPIQHIRPGLPPFLLLDAEHDLPLLPDFAKEMHARLLEHGNRSHHLTIPGRNHNSILFNAITADDPVGGAIVRFVRQTQNAADVSRISRDQK